MTSSMLKRVLSLSLLVTGGASCGGASGAGYQRVWIEATELEPNNVPLDTEGHCLTLPLLLGSRVEHTFESDTELEISAEATRDEFTITVVGAESVSTSHDVVELEAEFSETFEVTSDSGITYVIRLQSGC